MSPLKATLFVPLGQTQAVAMLFSESIFYDAKIFICLNHAIFHRSRFTSKKTHRMLSMLNLFI